MIHISILSEDNDLKDFVCDTLSEINKFKILFAENDPELFLSKKYILNTDVLILDCIQDDDVLIAYIEEIKEKNCDVKVLYYGSISDTMTFKSIVRSKCDGIFPTNGTGRELIQVLDIVAKGQKYIHSQFSYFVFDAFESEPTKLGNLEMKEFKRNILQRLSEGKKYSEIGEDLGVSIDVIRYHIKSIYSKLGVKNRSSAVSFYLRQQMAS